MSDQAGPTHLWIPTPEQEIEIELRVSTAYVLGHLEGALAMTESPPASAAHTMIKQVAASFHAYLTKYGNLVPNADVRAVLVVLDELLQRL